MNILLVNDDGYFADGIQALDRVLTKKGHRISILAPEVQQSGKSHSMGLYATVTAIKHDENKYSISGTPADCIIYGLKSGLLTVKPDLIVSGINQGYNISTDIIYSGTCGAARQASMYGYKAIAISEGLLAGEEKEGFHFERTASFLADNLDLFLKNLDGRAFLNINVPHSFNGEWELSSIGEILYEDKFEFRKKDENVTEISNVDIHVEFKKRENEYPNDFETVRKGKASLSYVNLFPTISHRHMIEHAK